MASWALKAGSKAIQGSPGSCLWGRPAVEAEGESSKEVFVLFYSRNLYVCISIHIHYNDTITSVIYWLAQMIWIRNPLYSSDGHSVIMRALIFSNV